MLHELQGWNGLGRIYDMYGGSMKIGHRVVLNGKVPLEHMDLTQARLPVQKHLLNRGNRIPNMRAFVFALLLCLSCTHGWAQQNDQQQMRGLDEQVQEIKSDVLGIAAELNQLEEKLLYPSGTQVAVFVALTKGD